MFAIRLYKKEKCGTDQKIDMTYKEQNVESKTMNTFI